MPLCVTVEGVRVKNAVTKRLPAAVALYTPSGGDPLLVSYGLNRTLPEGSVLALGMDGAVPPAGGVMVSVTVSDGPKPSICSVKIVPRGPSDGVTVSLASAPTVNVPMATCA